MRPYTIIPASGDAPECYTLDETALLTGLHPEMILEFVRAEYVHVRSTAPESSPSFDEAGILRLRQIEELQTRRGCDLRTIRYIIGLLDRLEAAEHELQILREQLR